MNNFESAWIASYLSEWQLSHYNIIIFWVLVIHNNSIWIPTITMFICWVWRYKYLNSLTSFIVSRFQPGPVIFSYLLYFYTWFISVYNSNIHTSVSEKNLEQRKARHFLVQKFVPKQLLRTRNHQWNPKRI